MRSVSSKKGKDEKMSLVIFNTMSGKKEGFVPIKPPHVGMYFCGITAYDSCHLGHARAAIVADIVFRYLKHLKYDVTFVRNYTDVDDKIIRRANEEKRSCKDVTTQYIEEYRADMKVLGVITPTVEPLATGHIDCMIETIKKLISKGYAYEIGGNVYFSVRKFKGYGKLSGKNIEELESGARVEVDETKTDPLDFALWKKAKPGEPKWQSPWGEGRPGWHIECSAMSSKYLGQPFDIHGGGRDLIFPHHENEIAQAEGAEGKQFVKYWIHNGFININAEKMSKSLGNIMSIRGVLAANDPEAVRLFLLSNHYRSPIDYTADAISVAGSSLERFYETAARICAIHPGKSVNDSPDGVEGAKVLKTLFDRFDLDFSAAMDDDFNTAKAIGHAFEVVRAANKYLDSLGDNVTPFAGWVVPQFFHMQHVCGEILGVFGSNPSDYKSRNTTRATSSKGIDPAAIEDLIAKRKEARGRKDFSEADRIRNELMSKGVEIKDRPDGTCEWKIR
jgi:cysteinyl-tRNA synthetase